MHYHLLLTERCNLKCRYCYEKSMNEFGGSLNKKFKFDFSCPEIFSVDIYKLKEFLKRDPDPVIIFYGGEPLLNIQKIKEIMDNIPCKFRMQTNGILLDKLPSDYLNKITKILVSIDGNLERTDFNRGRGTYQTVMDNINHIKDNGYNGEIIARMTIAQNSPDIYEQVLNLVKSGFKSVHWQLDAGFYESDFNHKKFNNFVQGYNLSISRLIGYWVSNMKKGEVLRFYPFVAIVNSLLNNEKTRLRCGAGHSGYAITTNGKISACPIMNNIRDFEAGDLDSHPKNLRKFDVRGRCLSCSYKELCGGRCLYWNYAGLWPQEGDELICLTIKHLIDSLNKKMPEIRQLIDKGIIKKEDFGYEKYFGPEIIP